MDAENVTKQKIPLVLDSSGIIGASDDFFTFNSIKGLEEANLKRSSDQAVLHQSFDIFTIPDVVYEIRDPIARKRWTKLESLVNIRQPSDSALATVISFAKKTGDYASLSLVDLKVIALAYDLEFQLNGTKYIKPSPVDMTIIFTHYQNLQRENALARLQNTDTEKENKVVSTQDMGESASMDTAGELDGIEQEGDVETTDPSAENGVKDGAEDGDDDGWTVVPSKVQTRISAQQNVNAKKKRKKKKKKNKKIANSEQENSNAVAQDSTVAKMEPSIERHIQVGDESRTGVENDMDGANIQEDLGIQDLQIHVDPEVEDKTTEHAVQNMQENVEKCSKRQLDDEKNDLVTVTRNEIQERTDILSQNIHDDDTLTQQEPQQEQDALDSESDDGVGWINPDNLNHYLHLDGKTPTQNLEEVRASCLTTDFAMQNVLLQMGLILLSSDGRTSIKKLKRYILKCETCNKITMEVDRLFCPNCGNNTLLKVAYALDNKGRVKLFINFKRKPRLRGTKYSIPYRKGGRKNNDIILAEDELLMKPSNYRKKASDVLDPYTNYNPGAKFKADKKVVVGYGRVNPNEVKPTGNRKKKRN